MAWKTRKSYKKKSYKRSNVDKWQTRQIKEIKKNLAPERKVNDVSSDYTADNTAWYVLPLSLMSQGDEYNQRNGRKVRAQSIFVRGQVKINPGATSTTVRMILFWDRSSNGQAPNPSDVMQTNADLQSPLDVDNCGTRFIVLADRTFDLSINGTRVKSFKIFRKVRHLITYNGDDNTAPNLTNGHLYLMWLSNETDAADKRAELNLWSRFSFFDV